MTSSADEFVNWLKDQLWDLETSVEGFYISSENYDELSRRIERRYRIELDPGERSD